MCLLLCFCVHVCVHVCMCILLHNPLHKEHVGGHIFCRMGTLSNYMNAYPQWRSIGSMGTEGSEGATPSDDVPESWGGPWRRQRYSTPLCRCTSPRRSEGRLVVGIVQSPVSRVQQWAQRTECAEEKRGCKRGMEEGKEKEEKKFVEGLMGGGRNKRSRREGGAGRRV